VGSEMCIRDSGSTGDNEIRRTAHIDSKGLSEKQTARPTTQ
jgi:hypothetical protein